MITITIAKIVGLIDECNCFSDLISKFDELSNYFQNNNDDLKRCEDEINRYTFGQSVYL